jgi:hypothetical protein
MVKMKRIASIIAMAAFLLIIAPPMNAKVKLHDR